MQFDIKYQRVYIRKDESKAGFCGHLMWFESELLPMGSLFDACSLAIGSVCTTVVHPLRDGVQLAEAQHGGKTLEDQIWLQELALVSAAWPARTRTASATSLLP